jgi:hypothetical protein
MSNMKKNLFPRILIVWQVTFEFEYLGEFAFIFEKFLDCETGSKMGSIDEKKIEVENLVQVYKTQSLKYCRK